MALISVLRLSVGSAYLCVVCAVVAVCGYATRLDASSDVRSSPFAVTQMFKALEQGLNARQDPFFHPHGFRVPLPAGTGRLAGHMDSVLLSGQPIADYSADITVLFVEEDLLGAVVSRVMLTEKGIVWSGDKGRRFVRYSVCESQHGAALIVQESRCDTAMRRL